MMYNCFTAKMETLVIGENPYTKEKVLALDPRKLGTNAVERLFWALVATGERRHVIALVKESSICFTNGWFETIKVLPKSDQRNRVNTGVVNVMLSDRVIVTKSPPIT